MASKPTYIDLFAGCGGLSLGLHNAGWQGLFAIEKSPDAFDTLKHNLIDKVAHFDWPDWLKKDGNPVPLDINNVLREHKEQLSQLNGHVDLVAGGPPCQGFSTAGRRKESDQRNNLVKQYIKFIRIVKPKLIFFENVRGFTLEFKKNRDKGKEYSKYVESALYRAGYFVKGILINFAEYGIPQKRTRFILVGVRRDLKDASKELANRFFSELDFNRDIFLESRGLTSTTTLKDAIFDLLKSNGVIPMPGSTKFELGLYSVPVSQYQKLMRAGVNSVTPDSHRFANHREDIVQKFQYIINYNSTKNKDVDSSIRKQFNIKKHTIVPLDANDQCPTITSLPDDYIHFCEPRIMTVREYARIQSFPDSYEFKGKYTTGGKARVVEVPRYTQVGNAIPPMFGELSGLTLKKMLHV
jgi:DNA (cytosine-5)-methyltransferase 1